MLESEDEKVQMAYAQAIVDWGDAGGYELETVWDEVCMAALGVPFEKGAAPRRIHPLRRRAEAPGAGGPLLRPGRPAAAGRTGQLPGCSRQALAGGQAGRVPRRPYCSSATTASCSTTLPPASSPWNRGIPGPPLGSTGGSFASYVEARAERNARFEELRKRWDEEHAKLKELVNMYRTKAAFRSDMANRYKPRRPGWPSSLRPGRRRPFRCEQNVQMRLKGGRTGQAGRRRRNLEMTGLMKPFAIEIWFGYRVGVLGSNGSGKSHFLRLLAAGGSDPDREHLPVSDIAIAPVRHTGRRSWVPYPAGLSRRPTTGLSCWAGRCWRSCIAATITAPGGPGAGCRRAGPLRARKAAEQRFESLSGGQQARSRSCCWSLRGDPAAARRADRQPRPGVGRGAGAGLDAFEGTVMAVTHDRWFARASTGFWSSDPTAACTSPPSRSGTRPGSSASADGTGQAADSPRPW